MLREEFRIEKAALFCRYLSHRKQQVLCDVLQLCVLYHITDRYLCLGAVVILNQEKIQNLVHCTEDVKTMGAVSTSDKKC